MNQTTLTGRYGRKKTRVYIAGRYSSPELLQALLDKGFYLVGTVMKSHKYPQKGSNKLGNWMQISVSSKKGQLLVIHWKDKSDQSPTSWWLSENKTSSRDGLNQNKAGDDHAQMISLLINLSDTTCVDRFILGVGTNKFSALVRGHVERGCCQNTHAQFAIPMIQTKYTEYHVIAADYGLWGPIQGWVWCSIEKLWGMVLVAI